MLLPLIIDQVAMSHTVKPHLDSHMLPVFARADVAFERGEGPWLIATNGDRYLDFTSGVAVNALGHAHPHLVAALQEQTAKLWHVSNLFTIPEGERLATRLCDESFADVVFFCNSGAEAMEAAIKMARKFQAVNGHPERYRLITFEGAFHGRTLATLAAGGQQKYLEGFGPRVDGFDQVPLGDLEAVKKAIGPHTAGILIEPWQGEGGVRAADPSFFRALRQLCDDNKLVLVFDEVDANIGGETANAVGEKMKQIAAQRQVFCITHLPQVAAPADAHYVVTKQVKDGRTISEITLLDKKSRVTELARMLGGQSEAARKHAEALLK